MPRRVAITNLNARTIDILNTIRDNASAEYQSLVPPVTRSEDIPRVGEVIKGYPAIANQFISALVNRIARVVVTSKIFNNRFADLKKGELNFGETIEEVFPELVKAREFSRDKAAQREFQRNVPDVKSAMHVINYYVQYPLTIDQDELELAFLSEEGVTDFIAKLIERIYSSAEYDEYLLFKYLIIKAIAHGEMYPVKLDLTDFDNAAIAFRGTSNDMTFYKTKYNVSGVHTISEKRDQNIFMDSFFNARYDVKTLAAAFNMDQAEFSGKLRLIDDFASFDNERFSEIRANSTMLEEVTAEELELCKGVKACLIDKEWFQIYDKQNKFTDVYVSSGDYYNYNYNVRKVVSVSPFSNAVVFVDSTATVANPASLTVEVVGKEISDTATILTLAVDTEEPNLVGGMACKFVQTQDATTKGIAVHPYGAIIFPAGQTAFLPEIDLGSDKYNPAANLTTSATVGTTIEFAKQ